MKRSNRISISLTDKELEVLKAKAEAESMSVGEYIRHQLIYTLQEV